MLEALSFQGLEVSIRARQELALLSGVHLHVRIPVALSIDVHPKLTYEHQSPYHQELHTQLCNPSCSDSANPSQIQIFSQAQYKHLLAKG